MSHLEVPPPPPRLATVTKIYKKTATIEFDTREKATITERSNFTFTPPNTPPLLPNEVSHHHLFPSHPRKPVTPASQSL